MEKTKEEFIKSRNLQKEYVERQEELSDACYDMTSDTDLSYIRFTQPNLDCDLDVFIKELQAIKKKFNLLKMYQIYVLYRIGLGMKIVNFMYLILN